MSKTGTLYLIPACLGAGDATQVLSPSALNVLKRLVRFVAENPRSARAFLKAAGYAHPLQNVEFKVLNEHTKVTELDALIQPLLAGEDCGLLSEAGCPAVADPGAELVRLAHRHGVRVTPLVGPSSILLALMASGLGGQRFVFHGYLPVEAARRRTSLIELERDSRRWQRTQIFIEAPYRNRQLLRAILDTCHDDTLLCLATDLTLDAESIYTCTITDWKVRAPASIDRRPTVFLLLRSA
jgi:16S rRNA (cytidine1402-2'-O)-methyltransferase